MKNAPAARNNESASNHGHNTIASFQQAVESLNGPMESAIQADGQLHRFKAANDRHGQTSGWYVLHMDGVPAGSYGNWKTGVSRNWCSVDRDQLTPAERDAMNERARRQRERFEDLRKQKQAATAQRALSEWRKAVDADPQHAYLQTKLVKPYLLRQSGDCLLVPLVDGDRLVNLQRIYSDGTKRFLAGGRISGCYSPIGDADGHMYICEGWATGATIHALTGRCVACAMNAGNLIHVALHLRKHHPGRYIVIAGDNDRHTEGNPGKAAAYKAARAIGGEVMIPPIPDNLPGTDYNDLYRLEAEGKL